ncbi:MAG: amino acid ABC transporter ATP-binding protein [Cyanobacteria bacterium NC_groundwater_1444_Ag_S-0.65um_54_12]|nr:amino acid ABC transporter ATP-binding protein [Cyanobacteria bacterium NC_groundwater_1444_Ag_S-0.65um_54_12]
MIHFAKVSKCFGQQEVLSKLDLLIPAGQKVVIIGPSGSGKSTLLRCINKLDEIATGQLTVLGIPVHSAQGELLNRLRADVGMVFQNFNLFPHKTVLENLTLAPMKVRRIPRAEAEHTAYNLLERVGIPEKAQQYPGQLSGGQQQRVAIARSLAMKPKIMLFDEPTSALDPEMIQEVLQVMIDVAHSNLTILVVTHELGFAREVADRVLFMEKGQIVEDSESADFFANPRTDRAREFLASVRHGMSSNCSPGGDF